MGRLVLIICTKDRPKDLKRLFQSIEIQTHLPDLVIVVDGSEKPIEYVLKEFPSLSMDYVTVRPPSLPKQRNAGVKRLPKDTQWVGFLDDDLVLEKDSLEQILKATQEPQFQKPLGGIGMMITNDPDVKASLWKRFFLLDDPRPGHFTPSGYNGAQKKTNSVKEVEWLSGGSTFWHKEVLDTYTFDEWFAGTGYREDVDFSYSVSGHYSLAYCGPARCLHLQHPSTKQKMFSLGIWQITSWWYFIRKFKSFHPLATLWSMLGITLSNLAVGILRPQQYRFRKFLGNLYGLILVGLGRATQKRVWYK